MLGSFYHQIYVLPSWFIIILVLIALAIWKSCATFADKKGSLQIWRIINIVLFVLFLYVILITTLRNRSNPQSTITWDLWGKWEAAILQPELYREMLMNVFLFVPFGLTLPFAVNNPRKSRRNWTAAFVTIWFGFLCSALIECMQLVYSRGNAEPEDIICNTIGAAIGTLAFIIWLISKKYNSLKKKADTNE